MVDSSAGEISNWLTPRRPLSAIAIPLKKANPPPKKGINSANEAGEKPHISRLLHMFVGGRLLRFVVRRWVPHHCFQEFHGTHHVATT